MEQDRNAEAIQAALRNLNDCAAPMDCRPFLKRVLNEVHKITTADEYSEEKRRRVILKLKSALRFKTGTKQQEFLDGIGYDIEHINQL